MSRSPTYPVGYKKPPAHSRFKPGQSGNPRGRPKKKTVGLELVAELNRKISVRENGVESRMSKASALAKSLVSRALAGDTRAIGHLIRLLPEEFQAPKSSSDAPLDAADAAALERFVGRRLAVIQLAHAETLDATTPEANKDNGDE